MTYRKREASTRTLFAGSILFGLLLGGVAYGRPNAEKSEKPTPVPPAALPDAVMAGDLAAVRKLVEQGADVNGLDTRPEVAGANGRRPLNWAAIRNDTKMIELLLELGADINGQNVSGFTPLHHAVEHETIEALKLLLARGADTTIENKRGLTPGEFAIEARRHRAAEALGVSEAE
jgi:ankyrin repeat protein